MRAHITSLNSHAQSLKHQSNMKGMSSVTPVTKMLTPKIPDKTMLNELKLAIYIAEHSSVAAVDHLGEVISSLDDKSEHLSKIRLHRTKCCRLQKYVLGPCFMKELRNDIGNNFYSVIVDESTNVANVQCLGIMVRYFSESRRKIIDTMYRLVPLEGATAEKLHQKILECLEEDNLPLANVVGIGSDGANAMVGRHKSVATLLQATVPGIVVFRCVCHSLHLAASKAAMTLPTSLEFLIRETHNWFSSSPKRCIAYQQIYSTLEGNEPKKIPGHCETRWLAREAAESTILDQWDALKLHFQMVASNERCYTAQQLSSMFNDNANKLFLLCLRKFLREVIKVNKLFQSENADVTKLTADLLQLYASLMQIVVIPTILEKTPHHQLVSLRYNDHLKPVASVHLGHEFEQLVSTVPAEQGFGIRERCHRFILELIDQIQIRLPDNIETLLLLNQFKPSIATAHQKPSLSPFIKRFRHLIEDVDELESQWNTIQFERWQQHSLGKSIDFVSQIILISYTAPMIVLSASSYSSNDVFN
jgi:hypothetical protein